MNAGTHRGDFLVPLLAELGVAQDGGHNRAAMRRRVRVVGANAHAHLAERLLRRIGRAGDESERADPFTIQAKILRERTAYQ